MSLRCLPRAKSEGVVIRRSRHSGETGASR
jgi:hypothetical protein